MRCILCIKAAECLSHNGHVVTHDTFNRFLTRQSLPPETLWDEVEPFVEKRVGWFVVDDTALDIENYHRALKELCCVEDCKIRKELGQRNNINCSLRAFIRLEAMQQQRDITIYQAKWKIIKAAIAEYVRNPKYAL